MPRKTIIGLAIVVLFVIAMRFYYLYDTRRTDKLVEQLNEEYPALDYHSKIEREITNIVRPYPKTFRDSPHHAFIVFDDSLKRRVNASYELLTDTLSLDDVLNVGDWLIKEPNSVKFFIYKIQNGDTLKYSFELNDDLGYPLKKQGN